MTLKKNGGEHLGAQWKRACLARRVQSNIGIEKNKSQGTSQLQRTCYMFSSYKALGSNFRNNNNGKNKKNHKAYKLDTGCSLLQNSPLISRCLDPNCQNGTLVTWTSVVLGKDDPSPGRIWHHFSRPVRGKWGGENGFFRHFFIKHLFVLNNSNKSQNNSHELSSFHFYL